MENPTGSGSWLDRLDDPDPVERLRAVYALVDLATPEAMARLRQVAESDADPDVRSTAADELRLLLEKGASG